MSDTYTTAIWRQPGYDLAGTNQSTVALQGDVAALSLYCYYNPAITFQNTPDTNRNLQNLSVNQFSNITGETGDTVYLMGVSGGSIYEIALKVHYDQTPNTPSCTEFLWSNSFGVARTNGYLGPEVYISTICRDAGQEKTFVNYANNVYSVNSITGDITNLTSGKGFTSWYNSLNAVYYDNNGHIYNAIATTIGSDYTVDLYKFTTDGTQLWHANWNPGGSSSDYAGVQRSQIVQGGGYVYWAVMTGYGGYFPAYILRLDPSTGNLYEKKQAIDFQFVHIAFNPSKGTGGRLYAQDKNTIYAYDSLLSDNIKGTFSFYTGYSATSPFAIRSDGIIFVTSSVIAARTTNELFAVKDVGTDAGSDTGFNNLSMENKVTLPGISIAGIIIDGNNNIILTCGSTVLIYTYDSITGFTLIKSFGLPFSTYADYPLSIGGKGLLYLMAGNADTFYAYGTGASPYIPSTSSSESSSSSSSESSQSLESESSESSLSSVPVTTTTTTSSTTTLGPLAYVQTIAYLPNATEISNASDSPQTIGALARTFAFGTIAPNEVSKTIVVALFIPKVAGIQNIKLGLISTGGIEFANDLFGITNSSELRYDIVPDTYFQNINLDKTATNAYNISILNRNLNNSNYVYLNVKLPESQPIGTGIINYRWFFDYSD